MRETNNRAREIAMSAEAKCPVDHGKVDGNAVLFEMTNRLWWPHQLDLSVLHHNPPAGDPMGETFDYAAAFKSLVEQAKVALA